MTINSIYGLRGLLAFFILLAPAFLYAQGTSIEYKGVIGGKMTLTMHLETETEQMDDGGQMVEVTRYTGWYSYDSQGKPIALTGSYTRYPGDPDDPFPMILLQEEVNGELTGSFNGQFASGGSIHGIWSNPEYSKNHSFVLYPSDAGGMQTIQQEFDALSSFWREFQAAVKKDDKEKIASMILFPLPGSGYVIERWDQGLNRKEFLKHYKTIFDSKAKRTVGSTAPGDLYPSVSSAENSWGIPGGIPMYYMVVTYEADGESAIGFGFGKIDGVYKLLTLEMAG